MTSLESQLKQTQQELEELKAEYQEFVYIVSHDLTGPFRTIQGFAEIIAKSHHQNFDEKTLNHLNFILDGAREGKNIVGALVEYSRLNTEAKPFTACNCNEVIYKVKERCASLINETQANISYPQLPVIWGDQEQITMLFYHLMHNALTYRKTDIPPEISISCEDNNQSWIFSFADNGIGIKSNLSDKIFQVLRRGVSKKEYDGMGIGLAIAKKIIQRHGGHISLDTESNNETIFHFTLAKKM